MSWNFENFIFEKFELSNSWTLISKWHMSSLKSTHITIIKKRNTTKRNLTNNKCDFKNLFKFHLNWNIDFKWFQQMT